ncbi:hypothetical protein DHD80_09315 [Gramella sp. AN32]|nr:hypothetical protein [Gramella sp. AN32]
MAAHSFAQENVNAELLTALNIRSGYKNLGLVNGVEYIETYRSINAEHQFLIGRDFYKGTLEYQGQFYKDIELKYDIFRDILVAKLQRGVQGTLILELIKDHVTRFSLEDKKFLNVQDTDLNLSKGFYEVILEESNLKLLKKHRLNAREKQDRSMAYYEFEKLDSEYYYVLNNGGYIAADRSDLLEILPDCKNEISKQFKANRSLKRKNPDQFWKELGVSLNIAECIKN